VITVAVFLVLLVIPLPGDLPVQGQRVLAVMGLAVTLWITVLLPPPLTGLLAVVLLVLVGGVDDIDQALVGFSKPVAYFLLGILTLGLGVSKSGLAERVAGKLTRWARGSPRLLFWQMVLSFVPMTLLLPSATTRSAIQVPIYNGVLDRWGVRPTHPFGRVITLALGSLNRLASTALLTGGIAPVTAAGLIGGMSWTHWFAMLSVPYYALLIGGGTALYIWYRSAFRIAIPETPAVEDSPWSGAEFRAAGIAGMTALLWFTDSIHHLHPAVPVLIALVLLVSPKIGVLSWTEFEQGVSWATFFVLATSVSLAVAMVESGVADWLARGLDVVVAPVSGSPIGVVMALMVAAAGIRMFIPNIVAFLAMVVPVAMSLAVVQGINPVVCGLAVLIAGDATVFYPAAGTSGVLVYGRGNVGGGEIFRLALLMAALAFVVVIGVALPWWSLVGEPLVVG
jgi:anion transporter